MTLATLMAGYTPSTSFSGAAMTDDYVLAIDCSAAGNEDVANYTVVQAGITGLDPQLEAETDEKTYIRQGTVTKKSATQRTFNISGDRMHGDEFQDFALAHGIVFGVGQTVIRGYCYFSLKTGIGEVGTASIIVNSDGGGEAGESAGIDIDISATGTPAVFAWPGLTLSETALSMAKSGSDTATVSGASGTATATASYSELTAAVATNTLTVSASASAVAGDYYVTVTDSVGQSVTIPVTVTSGS